MLVFANSFSAQFLQPYTELRKQFKIEPKNKWAADTSEPNTWIKEHNESFYGLSWVDYSLFAK